MTIRDITDGFFLLKNIYYIIYYMFFSIIKARLDINSIIVLIYCITIFY